MFLKFCAPKSFPEILTSKYVYVYKPETTIQLLFARDFKLIFFRENTAVNNLSNIQEVKTLIT